MVGLGRVVWLNSFVKWTKKYSGLYMFGCLAQAEQERDNIRVVFSSVHSCLFIFHECCHYRCLFVFAWARCIAKETIHGNQSKEEHKLVCISSSYAALLKKPFMTIRVRKSTNWYASLPAQFKQLNELVSISSSSINTIK